MDSEKPGSNQLDLLKELGTVGSASAATALSELIERKVEIIVPSVELVPIDNIASFLGELEKLYYVLVLEIEGDITGQIFLLFSVENAKNLADILLHKLGQNGAILEDNELFQSCLKESANILCGAYVVALSEMCNLNIFTSVPSIALDMVGAILDFIFISIAQQTDKALVVKTMMNVSGLEDVEGLFFMFPNAQSLKKIYERFGVKE